MMPGSQKAVADWLASGAPFGCAADAVRVVETHISYVVLGPERVLKMKKAVDFGYLDYSDAAARAAFCAREVAINRRTAPGLYEGVVQVTREPGGFALDGPGKPVESLVAMKRFPDGALLCEMADRRALNAATMAALGRDVAAFHRAAEPAPGAGGAAAMAAILDGALQRVAAHRALFGADADRVSDGLKAGFSDAAPVFDMRAAAGAVRRCHGDMHLGNVVMWQGRAVPFDAIEFSDRLASIDPVYDLAFLLMDLARRGLKPLAATVRAGWLAGLGHDGLMAAMPAMGRVLDFCAGLRAAIRAHIAATRGDPTEAKACLAFALTCCDRAEPRLIAIGGLSGTGKSTLAHALAPGLPGVAGAVHLRTDELRKLAAGLSPQDRLGPGAYTPEASAAAYRDLMAAARAALTGGASVILDGVFARETERDAAGALARETGATFDGLFLRAPSGTMRARVAARSGDASDADEAVVARQLSYDLGPIAWRRLNAEGAPEAVATRAAAALGLA